MCAPTISGKVRIESDGQVIREIPVRPGLLRFVSPGERTFSTSISTARAALLWIPGNLMRTLMLRNEAALPFREPEAINSILEPNQQIRGLVRTLRLIQKIEESQRQLFVEGLAYTLLACLFDHQLPIQRKPSSTEASCLTDAELKRCIDYAHSRISGRLELSEWANVLGMTPSGFSRSFKNTTKESPYTWWMNWRLEYAKQLLRNPKLSLAEVALHIGFNSQSHFTEAFKLRNGVAPGKWRTGTSSRVLAPENSSAPNQ